MLRLLKFLLIIAGAFLVFSNIEPYIAVTQLIFSGSSGVDVCSTIGGMPFVGGIFQGVCGFLGAIIYSLAGFIVWAIFQIVELLPIANSFNIPFISNVLAKLQNAPQVKVEEEERAATAEVRVKRGTRYLTENRESKSDRPAVAKTKKKLNTVVERSLGALLTFSWVMYLLDLGLMSWLYSPLSETGELDIKALMRVLLGVFGVQIVILGLTLISNLIDPESIQYQRAEQKPVREY